MSRLIARLLGPFVMLTLSCTQALDEAAVQVESDRYESKGKDAAVEDADIDASLAEGNEPDANASGEFDAELPPMTDASAPSREEAGTEPALDAESQREDAGEPRGGDDGELDAGDDELDAGEPPSDAQVMEPPRTQPDGGSVPPSEPATFSRVYAIFRQQCRSCHQGGSQFSLDLGSKASAYAELVGGPAMGAAEFITCANQGYFRVIPGQPDESLLIWKLEAVQPCGDQMPPGKEIPASQLLEVRSWIEAGALDN